jgi:tetratricopeptide (TPR) repeat protein
VSALQQPGIIINDILLEKSTDLLTAVLVFFKGSLLYLKHDFFYHVWEGIRLGPQVYANTKADLNDAINEFDQALFLQVTLKLLTPGPGVAPSQIEGAAAAELTQWLRASHWETEAELARHCRSRVEGTLSWVFELPELRQWRLGASAEGKAPRSLWLSGLPGVGKSTIAAYVIQALKAQHPEAAVAYFFCKASDAMLGKLPQLIRTLASQLAQDLPTARSHLQVQQSKSFNVEQSDPLFLYQSLVRDALQSVDKEVFIVLDGLDECSTEEQEADLQAILESLACLRVKLLVTSRVTGEISSALEASDKKELSYDDSKGDIELYIKDAVAKSRILEKGFKALEIDPPRFLTEKSGGNFLWVRLVLDSLKRKSQTKDFRDALDRLPSTLEGIYDELLQRLHSRESLRLALTIIRCVLHAARPLSVEEMETMVGLILQDDVLDLTNFVQTECGTILRLTAAQPATFYIVHETFRSFITTRSSSGESCADLGTSHLNLTMACLQSLNDPKNVKLQPIRGYAVTHWRSHLSDLRKHATGLSNEDFGPIFLKLQALLTNPHNVQSWIRDFLFQEAYTYQLHQSIDLYFDTAQMFFTEHGKTEDHTSSETTLWVDAFVVSGKARRLVYEHFRHVWLNTDWVELDRAEAVYRTMRALYDQPGEKNKIDLDSLVTATGFDKKTGIQLGNYAIALLVEGSEECVPIFQQALDQCYQCWHLHQGLAKYYEDHNDRDKAISCLEDALKVDTSQYPSAVWPHAQLVAAERSEKGDHEGAVEALRAARKQAPEKDAQQYWNAMAEIWEKQGNGNKMVDIYKEAIDAHPSSTTVYWEKMADTLYRGGAREMQWQTYRDAIKKDPENTKKYGANIREIATQLTSLCVWQPVPVILGQGAIEDPDNAVEYYEDLGKAYMAQRQWAKALEQFEKAAEKMDTKWIYRDIGHAYLGLGELDKALTAYEMVYAEATPVTRALTIGYVLVLKQDYALAASLFKSALNQLASGDAGPSSFCLGEVNDGEAQEEFRLNVQLALCYEALDRSEDAKPHLEQAVACLKPFVEEADKNKDRDLVYRHDARTYFHIGLAEERLNRREDAKASLERAIFLFEKTTLEGDDELQTSEAEEAAAALVRLQQEVGAGGKLTTLLETTDSMSLQRRLALPYTTDWYAAQNWEPPRRRGYEKWNKVSFTNKLICMYGERRVVLPWGFGHY